MVTAKPVRATNRRSKHMQGLFTLKHPEKYIGDPSKVWYMSSWEFETHSFFDNNPNVIQWASEEIVIPYVKPTDGRIHKYYIDYWVRYVDRNGVEHVDIIELKPLKQTKPPKRTKNTKNALVEQVNYAVNIAKWQAAEHYAMQRGWKFRIITEKSIFA